jgi:hypothetical protein
MMATRIPKPGDVLTFDRDKWVYLFVGEQEGCYASILLRWPLSGPRRTDLVYWTDRELATISLEDGWAWVLG